MSMKTKTELNPQVLTGISSIFAIKGGVDIADNETSYTLNEDKMCEFPCSEDSGFNFTEGTPSVDGFKIHGMGQYWAAKMTPGDTEVTIEIPCHDTDILTYCGFTTSELTITRGTGSTAASYKGKAFSGIRKAVILGLFALDDTEEHAFFIAKAKLMASVQFDGSNKPLCVVMTGTIHEGADSKAIAVLDLQAPATSGDGD